MKYLIAMFGDQATMVETKSTEWIKSMIRFMTDLDQELVDSGERVDSVGPRRSDAGEDGPLRARRTGRDRRAVRRGEGVARRLLDRRRQTRTRALAIASKIVAFIEGPIEVRQVADAPPEEYTS